MKASQNMEWSWMPTKLRLQRILQRLLAPVAARLLTMLVHAQSMVLSLLNRVDDEIPVTEVSAPTVKVWGCVVCGAIYSRNLYFSNLEEKESEFCPECGGKSGDLGLLPNFFEYKDGVYLVGTDGTTTGPYHNQADAQGDLWAWFRERNNNAPNQGADGRPLRLVSERERIFIPFGTP
jgi:DNA-directed RNA polymerase subunit RPC12/RpoP